MSIKSLQTKIGAISDGAFGPKTMKAEEFYKDHFGHTSQHASMDKIFVCMELYAKQHANKRVIEELEKIKGLVSLMQKQKIELKN